MSDRQRDRLKARSRAVQRELDALLPLFVEGSCPNPLRAQRETVVALFRAYLAHFDDSCDLGSFVDFVLTAIESPDTPGDYARFYERKAREWRMRFKPSAAAAKGWETRRRNQKARDTTRG